MSILVYGFGEDALATLMKHGATDIQFWCVGGIAGTRPCFHWHTVNIEALIRKVGAEMSLVMLARRARCANCGKMGCHVQAISTLGYGMTQWRRVRLLGNMIHPVVPDNDDDPGPKNGRGALKADH